MLIYDIEILNAVPPRSGERIADVQYCEGWNDHAGMGIAVIGCYDYRTDRNRVFCSDNMSEFANLIASQECIVGFNNHRFDDLILEAAGFPIAPNKSYDLLQEIWRGLELGNEFRPATHGGYGLEAMSRANFNATKNGNGADAPIQWQRGQVGTVVDYCLGDVHLTKRLLDRVIRGGALVNPTDRANTIYVRKPGARQ